MLRFILLLAAALVTEGAATPAWSAGPSHPYMVRPLDRLPRVRSEFGPRHDGFHRGVDLSAAYGSPVRAATAGIVVYAGRHSDYGNVVDLRSREGILTRYAHLSAISAGIRPGAAISAGKQLGAVGATGNASGPHLHFEVRIRNKPVNPMQYLAFASAPRNAAHEPVEIAEARDPSPAHHHGAARSRAMYPRPPLR
ncbi:MAG: M23 family metallopeptidase [Rhodospirillales bacterium]|nr:M23 family metallopeptidase [Rhodospirillales bacterium]